jgi:hypothetical protein
VLIAGNVRPVFSAAAAMAAANASHFLRVREAMTISLNTSGFWAHLWATTLPTPPAPMMMTFDILSVWLFLPVVLFRYAGNLLTDCFRLLFREDYANLHKNSEKTTSRLPD